MRGKATALLVGAVAGALAATAAGDSTIRAGTGSAQIRITETLQRIDRVDLGPRGTSPGDIEIVRTQLFNRRITTRSIGRSELVCNYVDSRRSRVCRGTYFLPRGKLVVGGSLRFRQFYDMAIVGGTGLFDNARGTLTVTRASRRPVRNVVFFKLVG
jgi:hypothetical protein